jgi:hypothetical protein
VKFQGSVTVPGYGHRGKFFGTNPLSTLPSWWDLGPELRPLGGQKSQKTLADPTRLERATFAFGGMVAVSIGQHPQ